MASMATQEEVNPRYDGKMIWLLVAYGCLAMLLVGYTTGIINGGLPPIIADLHLDSSQQSNVVSVTTLAAEARASPLLSTRMLAIATTVKLRPRDRRRRLRQLLSRSQCDVVRPKKLTVCGRCFLSAGTNPPCARWAASQLQQSTQGTERQCPCCVLFPRA